jgi:hypothetical protein
VATVAHLNARDRVLALSRGARRIADPEDPLGERARELLVASSGLSREGVELALAHCLETEPSEPEIAALCESVVPAPRVHVLLSANVFVAAHRAIALGLASSSQVVVRSSRREPEMAALLAEAAPSLFELTGELSPAPGDHVHAYGSDATLTELARTLPRGVTLHGHGAGFAVAIVEPPFADDLWARLALDAVLFDQRGCLSPRVVLSSAPSESIAGGLASALERFEATAPRGQLSADEAADVTRYRDTLAFAGDLFPAGQGYVSASAEFLVPPIGRNLHVVTHPDPLVLLAPFEQKLTSVGVEGSFALVGRAGQTFPQCRIADIGRIQSPPFDGPVDRRTPKSGRVL